MWQTMSHAPMLQGSHLCIWDERQSLSLVLSRPSIRQSTVLGGQNFVIALRVKRYITKDSEFEGGRENFFPTRYYISFLIFYDLCPESCFANTAAQAGDERGGLPPEDYVVTMIPESPKTKKVEHLIMVSWHSLSRL